jgi:hypothetical protein
VIYDITAPPGEAPYVEVVTQHLYPDMLHLPTARRFTDGLAGRWAKRVHRLKEAMASDASGKGQLLPYRGALPVGWLVIHVGRTARLTLP